MIQVLGETFTNDVVSTLLFLKFEAIKRKVVLILLVPSDEERRDKETVVDMLDTLQLETNQWPNYQPLQQQLAQLIYLIVLQISSYIYHMATVSPP